MSNAEKPVQATQPVLNEGKVILDDGRTYQGNQKVPVWRVRPKEGGAWLIDPRLADIVETLEGETSIGHSFVLERVEMTGNELAAMGEFDGW